MTEWCWGKGRVLFCGKHDSHSLVFFLPWKFQEKCTTEARISSAEGETELLIGLDHKHTHPANGAIGFPVVAHESNDSLW